MVKDWDYETGKKCLNKNKTNIQLCFYVLWSFLDFSQTLPAVKLLMMKII